MSKFLLALVASAATLVAQEPAGKAAPKPDAAAETPEERREALIGKPLPEIKALKVLNGGRFDLAKPQGKVLVIDFWGTWCPPCRAVVPKLVALQKEMKDKPVQVVGVTCFFGFGMDFSDPDAEKPNGGKVVPADRTTKLGEDEELKLNETFIKAFGINYPVVFADQKILTDSFAISVVPTIFVVGVDGNILGSVTGANEDSHKKVVALIEKGLAAKKP